MSITKVIKDSIDSNTVFRIRQEVRPDEQTVGITNLYYTDSSYANTSNTTISSNANSYIKIFGFGFQQNANVVLVPSQNNYLYSSDNTNFFENAIEANPYYVNWGEYRAQINQNAANTYPVATEYNLFLINPDGSNSTIASGIRYSNQNIFYGWTTGGHTSPSPSTYAVDISYIYRYDFSNETFQLNNNLNESKGRSSLFTNSIFGWIVGGVFVEDALSTTSNIERLNLFNDTSDVLSRKQLSKVTGGASSSKTNQYGYIIGGYSDADSGTIYSSIERLDMYNDSTIISARAVMLSNTTSDSATVQDSSYFWVNGGMSNISPMTFTSKILRLAFSSDTSQYELRVTSSLTRASHASVYDINYGWFGGGQTTAPAVLSTVERITFSSDTSALSSRGSLNQAKCYVGTTQDSTYGWFFNGLQQLGSVAYSYVDRITFSNDTTTATDRTYHPIGIYGASGMSNYQV